MAMEPCGFVPVIRVALRDQNAEKKAGQSLEKILPSFAQRLYLHKIHEDCFQSLHSTNWPIYFTRGRRLLYHSTIGWLTIFRWKHLLLRGNMLWSILICGLNSITTQRKRKLAIKTDKFLYLYHQHRASNFSKLFVCCLNKLDLWLLSHSRSYIK